MLLQLTQDHAEAAVILLYYHPNLLSQSQYLGELRNFLLCDIQARFRRAAGYDVFFLTGMEHGEPCCSRSRFVSHRHGGLAGSFSRDPAEYLMTTSPHHR